jgi:hypothetical protein
MEPEGSLPCSEEPATCPYPGPNTVEQSLIQRGYSSYNWNWSTFTPYDYQNINRTSLGINYIPERKAAFRQRSKISTQPSKIVFFPSKLNQKRNILWRRDHNLCKVYNTINVFCFINTPTPRNIKC